MDQFHYFAAIWPLGSSRWTLLRRCDSAEAMFEALSADEASRPVGSRVSFVVGMCDADCPVAKLDKELRRLPHRSAASFDFFFERLGRRVCRANACDVMTKLELGYEGPFVIEEPKQ